MNGDEYLTDLRRELTKTEAAIESTKAIKAGHEESLLQYKNSGWLAGWA